MRAQDGHTARLAGLEEQVSELQAAVDEVISPEILRCKYCTLNMWESSEMCTAGVWYKLVL